MSTISGVTSIEHTAEVTGSGNIQLAFAMLQLELGEAAKEAATSIMDEITAAQEEQAKVAAFLQEARQMQSDAASNSQGYTVMSDDLVAFMDTYGLAYDKTGGDGDYKQNETEWEVAVASLQAYQESLGIDTQRQMISLQDYMSQYNSYLSGANSAISEANSTLKSIVSKY